MFFHVNILYFSSEIQAAEENSCQVKVNNLISKYERKKQIDFNFSLTLIASLYFLPKYLIDITTLKRLKKVSLLFEQARSFSRTRSHQPCLINHLYHSLPIRCQRKMSHLNHLVGIILEMNSSYQDSFCSSNFRSSRDTFHWDIIVTKIVAYIDQLSTRSLLALSHRRQRRSYRDRRQDSHQRHHSRRHNYSDENSGEESSLRREESNRRRTRERRCLNPRLIQVREAGEERSVEQVLSSVEESTTVRTYPRRREARRIHSGNNDYGRDKEEDIFCKKKCDNYEIFNVLKGQDSLLECPVCLDEEMELLNFNTYWEIKKGRILPCGHCFCKACCQDLNPKLCPLCRKEFKL